MSPKWADQGAQHKALDQYGANLYCSGQLQPLAKSNPFQDCMGSYLDTRTNSYLDTKAKKIVW